MVRPDRVHVPLSRSNLAEPLLKWPGGKRAIAETIMPLIPLQHGTYYEPFAGGAAIFFALRPSRAIVSDTNEELINCYCEVRDNPDRVIGYLKRLRNSEEDYYRIRASRPRTAATRAARLIYLSKLAFNGIYRTNKTGCFNVPYGHRSTARFCDEGLILRASTALKCATIVCSDFEPTVASAKGGDVVYLDPPYTLAHNRNAFVRYNARIFSWVDQVRLAALASDLVARNVHVIVSNANHRAVHKLYPDFKRIRIVRRSDVAAKAQHRGTVSECVFYM